MPVISAGIILCLLIILSIVAFALKKVTIRGNIKTKYLEATQTAPFSFYYPNLVSGKTIVIPLQRDSAENYDVSLNLDAYHSIFFSNATNSTRLLNLGLCWY